MAGQLISGYSLGVFRWEFAYLLSLGGCVGAPPKSTNEKVLKVLCCELQYLRWRIAKLQLIFENVKSVFTGVTGGLGKPKTLISSSLGKPKNISVFIATKAAVITEHYTLYLCIYDRSNYLIGYCNVVCCRCKAVGLGLWSSRSICLWVWRDLLL